MVLLLLAADIGAAPSPTYHLRIRAVLAANDDGTHAASITGSQIQTLIDKANTVWAGAGIKFDFDPATDIENRNSTLLNNDCTIFYSDDSGPICDTEPNAEERDKVALDPGHDGKITVYFRYGGADFTCTGLSCTVKSASDSFSCRACHYVVLLGSNMGAMTFGHEVGHYLWNSHTFASQPKTLADVREGIKKYVGGPSPHAKSEGLNAFDGDLLNGDAADTPPDPGPDLWKAVKGDACATGRGADTQSVTVTFSDNSQTTYTLAPDRTNIMSYFLSCTSFGHASSPQQEARARQSIEQWNRGQLIGNTPSFAQLAVTWKGTLPTGATTVTPFRLNRRPHLLLYNANSGHVSIERVKDGARDGTTTVWTGGFKTGWTNLMPFVLDGAPHVLLYNRDNGAAKIIRILGAQGWTQVWAGGFKTGWTTLTPFSLNGAPHVLLYNAEDGAAKIIRILGTQGWTKVWAAGFKTGWTTLMPLILNSAPHALLYNGASGAVKIIRILGTQGWTKVWASTWTTGWTAFAPFDRGPQQRLVLYKAGTGQMKTLRVFSDGTGAATMASAGWSTGYSSIVPIRLIGTWYAFAYNKDNGADRIVQITQ